MIHACRTEDDFQTLLQHSQSHPVLLLKHSTRCPISGAANSAVERVAAEHPEAEVWRVLVVEDRPLSQAIAAAAGVPHQSPQAILFKAGQPAWHASHWSITADALHDLFATV